jgi:hypothetical protein
VVGRKIGADTRKGLVLFRVDGLLRADHITDGIDYPDRWAGGRAMIRRFACRGGTIAVTLGSDGKLFHRPQLVRAYVRGKLAALALVGRYRPTVMRVPLARGPHGACTVRFTIPHTSIPARVEPGSTDTRRLGIRFLSFSFS